MRLVLIGLLLSIFFTSYAKSPVIHTVSRGETIESIADNYGVTVEQITIMNPGVDFSEYFYPGMKINIPSSKKNGKNKKNENEGADKKGKIPDNSDTLWNVTNGSNEAQSKKSGEKSTNEENENDHDPGKPSFVEFTFTTSSFEHVKAQGSYGIGYTLLPWEIEDGISGGFHFSPTTANYGLVPKGYGGMIFKLGPAVGYSISPSFYVVLPLIVDLGVTFGEYSGTAWSMEISPVLYIGEKFGIFVGPSLGIPLEHGKVSVGFKLGLFIR